ncbi:imidazole glycerol phosphate synthase HisHF [Desulfurivibrio alkaliphilus]|uniref:Imidazole glycerol phosphate synthase subunit HisH n=1 Tax=Desulfurivibrio alkaliphilus (strain DSM 19089 / UNIQEM U267 / AHT2) TaxID=589865 RepID=D6Z5M1_DESAT|nr:imidazole glycerol phosphate synthase HisHF [Desulfurivibrio alkaliphilus]ADH86758.1 imidazoleglycerol phosphate synthase, cyclase subunit [Desulfurivibrio alkaliphilus AHT 2]
MTTGTLPIVTLLDYGAGNVRSVRNAIRKLGYTVQEVVEPADILRAEKLIFPGVGSFGAAMESLQNRGFLEPLRQYLAADRPYLGICLGLQTLFEGSEESPGVAGLGLIKGHIERFRAPGLAVPQIGWNGIAMRQPSSLFADYREEKLYFVHTYRATASQENRAWILAETAYGGDFISAVQRGKVVACQFHPEKSGRAGLNILRNFLQEPQARPRPVSVATPAPGVSLGASGFPPSRTRLAKRIIACLDVRSNDQGDLVVTKGDQYDVRESGGEVRNLGKPVELAARYFREGADEVTFLNITAFRDFPLEDQPMLEVLERASEEVFVPLTIGGGIREFTDANGRFYSALDVAARYFRAGADKISIGSDAVAVVEDYLRRGRRKDGKSSIEQIAYVYGNQAVVISIDPRRVYVKSPDEVPHRVIPTAFPGPNGEEYCWYQCTVKGGREGRDLDAATLAAACEELGAGEILLNCIDKDGTNSGFDLELIKMVKEAVGIPVIASSGAGRSEHFSEVFTATNAEAALAAGIFHRREVEISAVKEHLQRHGIEVRL